MYDPHLKLPPSPPRPVHYSLFWKSLWGESVAWVLYWIHWPRIYRIRSLAHCVTNISYWLHLNEGFRCNGIKTNKYVIFVLCVSKWSGKVIHMWRHLCFERKRGDNSTTNRVLKDEVLITVSCPIFPSILIAKYLFTWSLKNRSIDNLETQKKYISMKNSQFLNYLLYAKSK